MPQALLVVCCRAVCSLSLAVPVAAAPDPPPYVPPVEAVVSDPFRAPATPYGSGNRGLEYDTPTGTVVRAAGDGEVTFAGPVAGSLHVTILHPDGVRTTYSFLAHIAVVVGQRVRQGDAVGRTAGPLHFGARRGDAYFDPASLFERAPVRVRLVAFDDPPGLGMVGERSAISQLIGGAGPLVGAGGAAAAWLRGEGGALVRAVGHYGSRFSYPMALVDGSTTLLDAWTRSRQIAGRPCSDSAVDPAAPPERRFAVLVAGLGSNSGRASVDDVPTGSLGYASADVIRFSYAGGRVPDATDAIATVPARAYDPADTLTDLRAAGARLADLVEAVAAEVPGVPLDLIAHSQGGVVVRLGLLELERRHGIDWLERVGLVATLGTPHGGADLATAVGAWSATPSGAAVLSGLAVVTAQEIEPDATSVGQLAETSDLVAELAAHPVPDVVHAVSVAARGDLIVPLPRTAAPGMEEVVVPLSGPEAHSELPGSTAATRELALALAGLPPGCQSFRRALLDQGIGESIAVAEDLVGAVGLSAAAAVNVRGP